MEHLRFVGTLAMFLVTGLSVPLDAAESTIRNAYVTSVFAKHQARPRCAVKLDRDVAKSGSAVLACAAGFGDVLAEENMVFLDCGHVDDDYPQDRVFDLALLAFRTDRPVDVRVTDRRREGCFLTDIWVKRTPNTVERNGGDDHGRDDDDCEEGRDDADDCGVDHERRDDD